jgi:hypothetical protein
VRREFAEYLHDAGFDAPEQRPGPFSVMYCVTRSLVVNIPGHLLQAVLGLGSARAAQNHCKFNFKSFVFVSNFAVVKKKLFVLKLDCMILVGFIRLLFFSEYPSIHPVDWSAGGFDRGLLSMCLDFPSYCVS